MASPTDHLALDLHDVAKRYRGRIDALKGIDLRVHRGEIFGLLGPNGAGKSTLVKILMTIIRPTRAGGTVLGKPVGHKATLARIGYLPENHRFPRYLTGRQAIEFFGALSNVDRATCRARAEQLLDLVDMREAADRRISTYSKGMAQRIGLAQAMVNDPDLILLDEPTDGVDPLGRRQIRDALLYLKSQGKTIFINSHLLSELEMISDRVAILFQGHVVRQGTIDELTLAGQRYEVEIARDAAATAAAAGATTGAAWDANVAARLVEVLRIDAAPVQIHPSPAAVGTMYPVGATPVRVVYRGTIASDRSPIEIEGTVIRLGRLEPASIQPILDTLRAAGFALARLQLVRPSLEDLFIEAVAPPPTPIPVAALATNPATVSALAPAGNGGTRA